MSKVDTTFKEEFNYKNKFSKSDEDIELFKKDLAFVINKHSMENFSDTPDYILASYLYEALVAYNKATINRSKFYDISINDLSNLND